MHKGVRGTAVTKVDPDQHFPVESVAVASVSCSDLWSSHVFLAKGRFCSRT